MKMVIAVAAGGAMGAAGRYVVMVQIGRWFGTGFPWGTLAVNIVGCFVMGVLIEAMALVWSPSPELRALLTVGVLGGFTTFSTFSLDFAFLLQRGEVLASGAYVLASVALCLIGIYAGLHLARLVLA
ncbi:fluoride efflux transporter CrcB [Rhodospirillaceae bacterium SYSU D60014]|uniref:fluoride efflux transporter CrcB n=1 Tax=Virgifigura deserti TaxID=2268457 RepID=UPI000E66415F